MTANTSATLYHKTSAGYDRAVIHSVMWQGEHNGSISASGKRGAENTRVFIPFSEYDGEITVGDYLVRGICPFIYQEGNKISELTKGYSPLTVISTARRDYGSADMQHWEVTGK